MRNYKMILTDSFGTSDDEGANFFSKVNVSLVNACWFHNHYLFGIGDNDTSPAKGWKQAIIRENINQRI
ncbi:MAG: hypothetical protein JXR07_17925 [Reichenbachiella sp.]